MADTEAAVQEQPVLEEPVQNGVQNGFQNGTENGVSGVDGEHGPALQQAPVKTPVVQQAFIEQTNHVVHKQQTTSVYQESSTVVQEQATMMEWWPPVRTPTPSSEPITGTKKTEITLSKENEAHWGFRLGGGKEFGIPLSVIRVQLGGVAEQQGFRVGDLVEQINGIPTSDLTHNEALDAIKKSGSKCLFSISRNVTLKGKLPSAMKTMAQLQDFTIVQPGSGGRPHFVPGQVAAKATMRGVTLGEKQLNHEECDTTFTEEVIAETMTSHAEIVAGNALGHRRPRRFRKVVCIPRVNFHKFEPQYEHLALSAVYKLLLEEEAKRGKTMSTPKRRKPEVVQKKEPTPPPQEPTPPPPKVPTPEPPKDPTPAPTPEPTSLSEDITELSKQESFKDATLSFEEFHEDHEETTEPISEIELESEQELDLKPEPSPEYLEAEQPHEENSIQEEVPAPVDLTPKEDNKPAAYFQKHHELSKYQQELLERQIKQKMQLEDCRKRINHAQRVMYAPTIIPEETVVTDCVTGIERKLPKAGCRYKPSHPLTPCASMHTAFPTKAEAFEPFQARPTPTFQPSANVQKPLGKPACAVQCAIPMEWHPPNKLINGLPYKYTPTVHQGSTPLPCQEFLPPQDQLEEEKPKPFVKPVAHPLQPVPRTPEEQQPASNLNGLSEDEIAEMMSANAEVIIGQTLGVNFQKYMPGFDHLQSSAVYRMVHGLED